MKILITGAAGFIGSQLAYRLSKDNINLLLIDNFSYGHEENLIFADRDFRSEIIRMDIRDQDGIRSILKCGDVDYIYNIAGIAPLPDCQLNPQEAIDVNLNGFVNILEAARLYGAKKIIQASTNAIYENESVFPTYEEKFELPTLIYPNTKYAAERFAEGYCNTYGMHISCLRFTNVYGPHIDCLRQQPPFVAYMIRELYYGRTPVFYSTGEQRRDYIYIDDLLDLAIKVQKSSGFDVVNVSGNSNYSVNQIYEIAQEIIGKKIPAKYADDSRYWASFQRLFEGVYPIKESIINHEINKYTLSDNKYAAEKYSWQPKVSLYDGLKKLISEEFKLLDKFETD